MMELRGYRRNDAALIAERSRQMGLASGEVGLETLLPLDDAAYVILLALGRGSDGGFFDSLEEGLAPLAVEPGDLEGALDRLVQLRLVAERAEAPPHYQITTLGDAILFAEAGRRRRHSQAAKRPRVELALEPDRAAS